MDAMCSKCGAHLSSPWKFCPHCGAAATHPEHKHEPGEVERAPITGAFSGLLFGMLVVPMLVIVGTMLCLTGLGAFLGVPLIVLAVFAPLLGPMIGIGNPQGNCPWCGTRVSNVIKAPHFYCYACSRRIALEDRRFVKAE
ncbi:MAG: zinc ribbon domain-containing protein [Terracidiphilus sp.]